MKNSGPLLNTFDLSAIQKPTSLVNIKDFSFIASYNWSISDDPVIFVPGCPARWSLPSLPYQVEKDSGQVFIDQNSHRSPSASFDPLFKALLTMNPNLNMKPIGLTTDRNSLRKLLQFVSGKVTKSWRIDVDIIEDAMFFTRWEESQVMLITGARDSGYGHGFEKAFLSFDADLQESSGHHRIVRYNLGGIDCLVRFEVDGYISDDDGFSSGKQDTAVDELGQGLSCLHIQNSTDAAEVKMPPTTEVRVIQRGGLVNNDTIAELKSLSTAAHLKMQEYIPQLWISQTRHLFVCRHKEGLMEMEPQRVDITEQFPDWESRNQQHLRTLVGLISEIKKVVKRAKGGKCMLVLKMEEKPRVLRVYQRNGKALFLPKGTREKYWGIGN
ncbi:hypothetical protein BGZ57DRAFT_755773 [Hyaloscypha finlandica]|nr:hypothetical protein BGZ57DRAFT_755773 [Hyaloscypha finlandica]